ncbi:MAG: hypothetical protein KA149_07410 [Chitinophagales bacterium]|nr:hypothetical protein [Chitinophagales bacterium]
MLHRLLLAALLVILCTTSGCKKCYTCTKPDECGSCDIAGAQGPYMCASVVPQKYAQAKAQCQANRDYWRIYSTANNVEDHCEDKADANWVATQKNSCEAAGGVWNE